MPGPGLTQDHYPTGRLSIEGVSGWILLATPAYLAYNLLDLWAGTAKRGADTLLPGSVGVIANRRRTTAKDFLISLAVAGDCNQAGVAYPDPWVGLETNTEFLRAQLVADVLTDAGTRNARLTMPSGVDRTAAIHVVDLVLDRSLEGTNNLSGAGGVIALGHLAITIPSGRFQ